jgi:hypothetical protein
MLVPFEKLDASSRIWIYQSDRKLSGEEQEFIQKNTESFLVEWTAHGNSLYAGMQILHNQFLVIGVNEAVNEASGCSIDKSVNYVRELGKALNIDLLQKSKIAIKQNAQIHLVDFSEISHAISNGMISKETRVFNNAIWNKHELESSWLLPAADSWLKRYFRD